MDPYYTAEHHLTLPTLDHDPNLFADVCQAVMIVPGEQHDLVGRTYVAVTQALGDGRLIAHDWRGRPFVLTPCKSGRTKERPCPNSLCDGSGNEVADPRAGTTRTCSTCKGTGRVGP